MPTRRLTPRPAQVWLDPPARERLAASTRLQSGKATCKQNPIVNLAAPAKSHLDCLHPRQGGPSTHDFCPSGSTTLASCPIHYPMEVCDMVKRILFLMTCAALASGLYLGLSTAADRTMQVLPVAFASCSCPDDATCADGSSTSAVSVSYVYPSGGSDLPVNPDSNQSDSWTVTATWRRSPCDASYSQATAYITVYAGGSTSACSGCGGPINSISLCGGPQCSPYLYGYKLIADVDDPSKGPLPVLYYLQSVDWSATTTGDGHAIDMGDCSLSTQLQVDGITSVTDCGPFECPFNCSAAGPSSVVTFKP